MSAFNVLPNEILASIFLNIHEAELHTFYNHPDLRRGLQSSSVWNRVCLDLFDNVPISQLQLLHNVALNVKELSWSSALLPDGFFSTEILVGFTNLTFLDISENSSIHQVSFLSKLTKLQDLRVRNNDHIDSEELSHWLPTLDCSLLTLDISGCAQLSKDNIYAILSGLRTLERCSICETQSFEVDEIAHCTEVCPSLRELFFCPVIHFQSSIEWFYISEELHQIRFCAASMEILKEILRDDIP